MRRWRVLAVGAVLGASALSLLYRTSLSYDAWAWLVWGRQLRHFVLYPIHGPSWKPLPVIFALPFSLVPSATPSLWTFVARSALIGGILLGACVAARLAGGGAPGALAAGAALAGVAAMTGASRVFALSTSEGWLILGFVGMIALLLSGRPRAALAAGAAGGLVRPEIWPLLAALGLWMIARDRRELRFVALLGVATVLLWIVPDWIAVGDPLLALHRAARVDPGTYAALAHPTRSVLSDVARLLLPASIAGAALAVALGDRRLRLLVAVGGGLLAIVVAGVVAGEAGTQRYLLPGGAALAIAGAAGWGLLARRAVARGGTWPLAALAVVAVALFAVGFPGRAATAGAELEAAHDLRQSVDEFPRAVAAAGGRAAVLGPCGKPTVGNFQMTFVAWRLRLHFSELNVGFPPQGVVLQERVKGRWQPGAPVGSAAVARVGRWRVMRAPCYATKPG